MKEHFEDCLKMDDLVCLILEVVILEIKRCYMIIIKLTKLEDKLGYNRKKIAVEKKGQMALSFGARDDQILSSPPLVFLMMVKCIKYI
jgi:hypothetical protein